MSNKVAYKSPAFRLLGSWGGKMSRDVEVDILEYYIFVDLMLLC